MGTSVQSYSVILEFENSRTVSWERVGETLRALGEQIKKNSTDIASAKPEVICVHADQPEDSEPFRQQILKEVPDLDEIADLTIVEAPEARYYELKNAGIERARGEIVVLLDSDVMPETNWLRELLKPFDRQETIAVAGHTYLEYRDLISKTLALVWVFPLRESDQREIARRTMAVNNCAFRGEWIQANKFPQNGGFKVSCTLLLNHLKRNGHEPIRVPALVGHEPLSGFRFLIWRALITGSDADRKLVALKTTSRVRRLGRAFQYGLKRELRAIRRLLLHHRKVSLPVWQLPAAMGFAMVFYALMTIGQTARAIGLTSGHANHLPDFVEAH